MLTDHKSSEFPIYKPQYGSVDFAYLLGQTPLRIEDYANQEFLVNNGMAAMYELFSDGQVVIDARPNAMQAITDKPFDTPELRHGDFYIHLKALMQLYENQFDNKIWQELNKLQRFVGQALATEVINGRFEISKSANIMPSYNQYERPVIQFLDQVIELEAERPFIIDIGPGTNGIYFLDAIEKAINKNKQYCYLPICNGPFINEYLITMLKNKFGIDGYKSILDARMYVPREDGMQSAVAYLIETSRLHNIDLKADIVTFSGLSKVSEKICAYTLPRLNEVVKSGGKLLLSGTVNKIGSDGLSYQQQKELLGDHFNEIYSVTKKSGNSEFGLDSISTYTILERI